MGKDRPQIDINLFYNFINSASTTVADIVEVLKRLTPEDIEAIQATIIKGTYLGKLKLTQAIIEKFNSESAAWKLHKLILENATTFPVELLQKNVCSVLFSCLYEDWGLIRVSALHRAVIEGKSSLLNLILNTGIDANLEDENGITPLLYAIRLKNYDFIEILLNNNANPNFASAKVCPPLHLACFNGDTKIAKKLIEAGADINFQYHVENKIFTPLHCGIKHPEIVQLLLSYAELNPNVKNHNLETPLALAIKYQCVESVEILLQNSKFLKIRPDIAYDVAINGSPELLKVLEKYQIDLNCTTKGFEAAVLNKNVDNALFLWNMLDITKFVESKFFNEHLREQWIYYMVIPSLIIFSRSSNLSKEEYKEKISQQLKGLIQFGIEKVQNKIRSTMDNNNNHENEQNFMPKFN